MPDINDTGQRAYNAPDGTPSDIGSQFNTFYYQKKALIEMRKEQYFGQMSSTTNMPKHMGKSIKMYQYLPLLDDANVNDQGIDAAGLVGGAATQLKTIVLVPPGAYAVGLGDVTQVTPPTNDDGYTFTGLGTGAYNGTGAGSCIYGTGVDDAAAQQNAISQMGAFITVTGIWATDLATWKAAGGGANESLAAVADAGNLYGSSKDVGTISAKMPALSETGGRVNRVGFKRVELEGSIEKLGFFDEYTKESVDFDTDSELMMHVNREMLNGANEITEDALQIDLLNAAGVIRYGGDATSKATITGDTGSESLITYEDLMRLSIDLDNNRVPKSTKIITGSRMVDTRTVNGARYIHIGSELIPLVKRMTDLFGNQAFISVEQYASAGTIANGEIGVVDQFRIIVVPEMMHWAGAGAAVGTNAGYRETGGSYDVYPMLFVGSESFVNIGFQTDGKTVKFKIKHSKPESDMSYSQADPFGEIGFMSIKWYYGILIKRPERIALCLTVAEY